MCCMKRCVVGGKISIVVEYGVIVDMVKGKEIY